MLFDVPNYYYYIIIIQTSKLENDDMLIEIYVANKCD